MFVLSFSAYFSLGVAIRPPLADYGFASQNLGVENSPSFFSVTKYL